MLACLIDIGFQVAATVPEGKGRSRILLRALPWQGKACSSEEHASEEPGTASPGANTAPTQPCCCEACFLQPRLAQLSAPGRVRGAAHGIAAVWAALVPGVSLLQLSEEVKKIAGKMLDLSFLTEEEYEKLMKVLQRDAELKKKDGDRIR